MDKTIKISEVVHAQVKKYCENNDLKLSKWIESVLKQKIKEVNDNKQNCQC
jgi:hypothetical protein